MDTGQAVAIVISVASVVTAAVAAFYAASQAISTHEQARAAEQALRDQAQPYVYVDLRPDEKDPQVISLVVENTGRTVARNVRIDFDPPLESAAFDDVATLPVLTNGLSALPPGRKMTWLFDIGLPSRATTATDRMLEVAVATTVSGIRATREQSQDPLDRLGIDRGRC